MTSPSIDTLRGPDVRRGRTVRVWLSEHAVKLTILILVSAFGIYRLLTFVPQPLDGPHTLRPILNALFDAFLRSHRHPEMAYEDWRALCLWALLVAPLLAVLNFVRERGILRLPERASRILCSRGLLFAGVAAALLLCRFPTLLDYQLNPDEGEFLSAAHKLFYDGNFFASVDCHTSGPLNIYPLMLPAILGLSPDYASSRMLALLVAFCAIYLLYRTVRLLAPDSIARIAILPLAAGLSVFENPNLVHYNSEQIPVLLIALAIYFAGRLFHDPANYRTPVLVLGFLASAAFFSKLQSVPIVGAIGVVAVIYAYAGGGAPGLWRPAVLFIAGILPLQLVNAAICVAGGVWKDFWAAYIISNIRYADLGSNFVTELPGLVHYFIVDTPEVGYFLFMCLAVCTTYAFQRLRRDGAEYSKLIQMVTISGIVITGLTMTLLRPQTEVISAYLLLLVVFVLLISAPLYYHSESFGKDPIRWFGLLSISASAAAVFSIYRPHRPFPHYLVLLFVPVSAAIGWMLIRESGEPTAPNQHSDPRQLSSFAFPLLVAVLALTHAIFVWGWRNPHNFRTTVATIRQPEGDYIRALTRPDGEIFVWGWTGDPYLGSGRVGAAHDFHVLYQLVPPEGLAYYYRHRLLDDLVHYPPELIVDAIGPNSWSIADRSRFGLDQVPEIASFVNAHYRHTADAYGERFFLRADLAYRAALVRPPKTCAQTAVRCAPSPRRFFSEGAMMTPVMDDLPAVKLPEHSLLEVQFTPFGRQSEDATVINNEAVPNSRRGFRFQNIGGDLYRLVLGVGDGWAFSKPILLPDSKPASVSFEFLGTEVRIRANGGDVETMHLPAAVADTPGPITIGSWINGGSRFSGTIQFFQIVDLGKSGRLPGS